MARNLANPQSRRGAREVIAGTAWLLLACLLLFSPATAATEPLSLFGPPFADTPVTTLQRNGNEPAPASFDMLERWMNGHARVANVDMLGGNYWLVTRFKSSQPIREWSVSFANTWYQRADITILGDDGSRQQFELDWRGGDSLLGFHGVEVRMAPGHEYVILVATRNPFFTSLPRIDVQSMTDYQRRHANETVLVIATLGLMGGLGVFIFFIGLWINDRSYQLYGVQALVLMLGWGFYFGLPVNLFDRDTGWLNFTFWFIVLPIVHAPFTVHFLALQRNGPRLARVGYAIAVLAALLLPVALVMPSLSFFIATFLVTLVVGYSTLAGAWALRSGIRQARFFTLAYLGVVLPGLVILPGNFGLIHDVVDNADLLTLLGNGSEAMLLAFALADNVKLLTDARERFRRGMQDAINQASVDPLTGLGNRLAFNVLIEEITNRPSGEPIHGTLQIAMIDLDGLKQVNDSLGHARGDELLRAAGTGLAQLVSGKARAFRLGGDEFAVIAFGDDLSLQRLAKSLGELDKGLRSDNFPGTGISFGLCSAPKMRRHFTGTEIAELVHQADHAMYQQKLRRRMVRASGSPLP